jgi:flagellar assembly factor FliW
MTQTATFQSQRFGQIPVEPDDVVTFPEGLLGFPLATRWIVVSHREGSAFRWLQSLEYPELAFLVVDPNEFQPGYGAAISASDASGLEIGETTPTLVYTIVTIPQGRPDEMTINLAGPIVINAATRRARQVVIEDPAYPIRYRVAADRPESQAA